MPEDLYSDIETEKLRTMTGGERLRLGLELTERWRKEQIEELRDQNPNAHEGYIQHLFTIRMMEIWEAERKVVARLAGYFLVLLWLAGCASAQLASLEFRAPPGWKVSVKQPIELVAVTSPHNASVLMFSPWPPPATPSQIPDLVKEIADGFLKELEGKISLKSRAYKLESIQGANCEGNFALFRFEDKGVEHVQSIFSFAIANRVWQGQFTGTSTEWPQALGTLRSLEPKLIQPRAQPQ
jgi:hypothetical protein